MSETIGRHCESQGRKANPLDASGNDNLTGIDWVFSTLEMQISIELGSAFRGEWLGSIWVEVYVLTYLVRKVCQN